ncbi:MAG TPA: alpha/beta hydrolase [Lapillicoccus sp.]|nr:alpha/beta hydrolase [Lapillicoccus sp.]
MSVARPPFDPELEVRLAAVREHLPATITPEMITPMREAAPAVSVEEMLAGFAVTRTDHSIAGHEGGAVEVSVLTPTAKGGAGPGILYVHGGGMVSGDRFGGVGQPVRWAERFGGVCVTVGYRLAPDFPDPYPVEDTYAALTWMTDHAAELGIDPARVVIVGRSAGGGLAAGSALLARDRGGPALLGQLLISPMLDDRNDTVSSHQIDGVGIWDRTSNDTGWTALLGDRRGTDAVSVYAAPARATDLAGLPPAYIDCGTAEVFRDEDVAYASALWAAGTQAELHVWPGGFHACDLIAPDALLCTRMTAARDAWLARLLGER